jgi:hypothetical protein
LIVSRRRYFAPEFAHRPGTVTAIRGIVFQNDGRSTVGRIFIRPMEALDRWIVGILPRPGEPPLAMHAGIHVEIEGALDYVAEQLVGSFYLDLRNGLNWTPYEKFAERDRGGWDVTVPATNFRGVDEHAVGETVRNLNDIHGHPFIGEDCTAFIERAFGGRRLFADSPLLRALGLSARIGDPALPLLRPDAAIDAAARVKLQFDKIKDLPQALADPESPNLQLWAHRLIPLALLAGGAAAVYSSLAGGASRHSSDSRRSTPASRTARRFLR